MDNTGLAHKKNRVGKSKLESELHRLDKEQKTDLRMINNEKQRFKSRYWSAVSEYRGNEPSNLVMYETHNPGFCYRRNGECRMAQNPVNNTSLGFEDIHALVFSEDEVDIDKVLCLHLLSAHKTETLTPPLRSHRAIAYISKEQSPLERLIERSKKRYPEDKLTKLLPAYVLESSYKAKSPHPLIRDGRLANRLLINEKVMRLIRSVMLAFDKSNKDKLSELVMKSKDEDYLKSLLCGQNIQAFIKNLNGLNIISCCESFHLTAPFRTVPIILEISTPNRRLENLLMQIRKNIFKLPISSTWDNRLEQSWISSSNLEDGASSVQMTSPPWSREKELFSQRLDSAESTGKDLMPLSLDSAVNAVDSALLKESVENVYVAERKIRSVPPTRLSPDKSGSLNRKHQDGINKRESSAENFNLMDFERVANFLCKKADNANKKDLAQLEHCPVKNPHDHSTQCCFAGVKHKKYSIKQITCPACLRKWKMPLPAPKTSKIRKQSGRLLEDETVEQIVSTSTHFISKMIDQELKNWSASGWKSPQTSTTTTPRSQYTPRSSAIKTNAIEVIDLDDLDLAKIRQEIRENETKKKLRKFLGERN